MLIFGGLFFEPPKPKPYAEREIQLGEDCPHCGVKLTEVLTTHPPRCPRCLGYLAPPPVKVFFQDVELVPASAQTIIGGADPLLPEDTAEFRDKDGNVVGVIANIGKDEP